MLLSTQSQASITRADLSASEERAIGTASGVLQTNVDNGGHRILTTITEDGPLQIALADGEVPVAFGADTLVTITSVRSFNPLAPTNLHDARLIDLTTGRNARRCATAASRSSFQLSRGVGH